MIENTKYKVSWIEINERNKHERIENKEINMKKIILEINVWKITENILV